MPGRRYPHRYRYGKQKEIMEFDEVKKRVAKAEVSNEEEAYFWLLYLCGVRKSEGYERVAEDCKVTKDHFIIDFHQRKKGGAEVPPLKLPLDWIGVDKMVIQLELARVNKPRFKNIFFTEETGETKISPKGRVRPVTRWAKKKVKARWLFPKIHSTKAWEIVKQTLGKKMYPHFLRLNRLTEIGTDPNASLTSMKSFSGIKSISVLQGYLGTSEREQDKTLAFMDKKMQ